MNKNNSLLVLISIIISGVAFTGCSNAVLPDEHGRICEPGSIVENSAGCNGCDLDASAIFCTADGRDTECVIHHGPCHTDPGCPGGEARCGVGVGACLRHGRTSCPAGSSVANVCDAVAGTPGAEICGDTIDNDCDGTVDDGCPTCTSSGVEICDNLDNDCDMVIDDGCDDDGDDFCDATMNMGASGSHACPNTPPGRSTGDDCDDTSSLRHPGAAETCGDGVDQDCNGLDLACVPMCVPVPETCNNVDDDCDGTRDDGVTTSCYTGLAITRRVGACRDGVQTCSSGSFGSCIDQILPATEICSDTIDNDCDGIVNDGCPAACVPTTEVCNSRDDDCDGSVDELGVCGPTCGAGALVGSELCVEYSGSVPSLATVGGVAVTSPSIAIFNCAPGGISSFAPGTSSCIPLNESCFGWLATTATQGSSADERNFTSWSGYMGRTGTSMGIRVFARTGSTVRELSALSWIANDPTGGTYSSYVPAYVGTRYVRLMVPVREDCAVSSARPPDHY